jgi:hypothetical protein
MAKSKSVEICISAIPSFVLGRIIASIPTKATYSLTQGKSGRFTYFANDIELEVTGLDEIQLAKIVGLVDANCGDYTVEHF